MIPGIASLIFVPLLAIFFAHIMWAFGSTWPVADETALTRTVTGMRNASRMPPRIATFFVAIAVFAAGIIALMLTDPGRDAGLTAFGAVVGTVFLVRGVLGYTPKWRAFTPEEPFATLDRRIYSPVCLFIAAGYALLTIWRLI